MGEPLVPSRPRWQTIVLVAVTVGLDLVLFSTLLNASLSAGTPAGLVVGYAVVGGAILYWQRFAPLAGFVALWVHAVAAVFLNDYRPTLPLLVGLYLVASRGRRRPALLALVSTAAPISVAVLAGVREAPPGEEVATLIGLATMLALVHSGVFGVGRWAAAVRVRTRRLEAERASAAESAIEDERARISSELHDTIAHSVTIMALQAAGAKKVMHHDPERAQEALTQVGGAGVQAMNELRELLTALRPDDQPDRGRLCELDQLVGRIQAVGVTVAVRNHGRVGECPADVDLVAYRVIQEALTNAAKHAGPGSRAVVDLRWRSDDLVIAVSDDGAGDAGGVGSRLSSGNGLRGLAARVAAIGGALDVGPGPGGGFRLRATLPLAPAGRHDHGTVPLDHRGDRLDRLDRRA